MAHEEGFSVFHTNNPKVYELFRKFTLEVINRGYEHYSADAIMHRVRWETNVVKCHRQFKINNNFVTFYARLFMAEFPQHEGFFETRTRISA